MTPLAPSVHQMVPPRTATWNGARAEASSTLRSADGAAFDDAGFAVAGAVVAVSAKVAATAATVAVVRVLLRRLMGSSPGCEYRIEPAPMRPGDLPRHRTSSGRYRRVNYP